MPLDLLADLATELDGRINSCAHHAPQFTLAATLEEAHEQWEAIQKCRADARHRHLRWFAQNDLWFLARYVLGWDYADHPWIFDRAREVQAAPDGYLDLWARGHMKSHLITHANTIREVLNNPDVTICIFSYNRPAAKAHLRKVKQIFETCEQLRDLFPEIIWKRTDDAPKWSEDEGLCVKRGMVKLEQTIEAAGLVDAQPVGRHYDILVYDDVVTADLVTNPDMISNVTNMWELSLSLSQPTTRSRYVGTFYHANDTYHTMLERGVFKRRYPVIHEDGPDKGKPVFFSVEQVEEIKRTRGARNFAYQYLLDEKQDTTKLRWKVEWLNRYHNPINNGVSVYILVDPAGTQKKKSDYTTIGAIGLGADLNYYLLDYIRDKLTLKQRTDALFAMHQKFTAMGLAMKPKMVGYEKYGKDSDIEHIELEMSAQNYHFPIVALGGNQISKEDRINKLQPSFETMRWYLPQAIYRVDYEGNRVELISQFIQEEYLHWPDPVHDDGLDMMARIFDPKLGAKFPIGGFVGARPDYPEPERRPKTWMGV